MTRKQYIRRLNELTIAIHRAAGGEKLDGNPWKLGESLKYNRDHAMKAAKACGSYQDAWDNLKPAREMFGVE